MFKTFSILTATALVATSGAMAQESTSAPSRDYEHHFTWTSVDLSTLPLGEGQVASVSEVFIVHAGIDQGPLSGLAARCVFMGVTDLKTNGLRDAGTCVYQDADGDQLWEQVEGMSQGNGSPYGGTGNWIGGTGRFEGASGEHSFETAFSATSRSGVYQGTGVKHGNLVVPSN